MIYTSNTKVICMYVSETYEEEYVVGKTEYAAVDYNMDIKRYDNVSDVLDSIKFYSDDYFAEKHLLNNSDWIDIVRLDILDAWIEAVEEDGIHAMITDKQINSIIARNMNIKFTTSK